MEFLIRVLDWFIPAAPTLDRPLRLQMRNYVATHLVVPLLASAVGVALLAFDPAPWPIAWIIAACIVAIWGLPLVLRATGDIVLCATLSVQLLSFTCLFGAFHYGGVSSPFLSWLMVALMLGFFYLNHRPRLVLSLFAFNFAVFYAAYALFGFDRRIPLDKIEIICWVSIASATAYMSWMAVYYAILMRMGSELEREAQRHRDTAVRLQLAKDRAEKANRARSIFLAKMSHELRTPLNAVIGYSEILLESAELDGKPPGKKFDLERIKAAGKHLLALVDDVMDLTRIERDEIELHPERFDLDPFLRAVLATTAHLAAARGNRVVYQVAVGDEAPRDPDAGGPGLGEAVTDPTKLRQVVMNLLSNAAKFTENGVITLVARREARPGGDWIEVQVHDTGVGIAPQERERLFQPYGQASAAVQGKYGGTGLGLTISEKLCALMGGGITLVSEKGRGSCFTVRVPADWAADAEPAPAPVLAAAAV